MRNFLLILFLAIPIASQAIEDSEETININSVTIMAASSMTVPVTEIAKQYSRVSRVDVNTVYNDSNELHNQILEGDPADILITADKKLIDEMKEEGLIDATSIKTIGGNNLHLVASKEMVLEKNPDVKNVLQQIYNKSLIIISDPSTMLGAVSKESLQKLNMWDKFESRAVLAPTSSKAIDLIIKGQTAGIVYGTDAKLYKDQINDFGQIPETAHKPIIYYVAVVVGDNMDRAREALKFINSNNANEIIKSYGFKTN